jgi:hypothetical protein
VGASVAVTQTTTQICGSQGCVGPISDLLSGLSNLTPNTGSGLSSQPSVFPAATLPGGQTSFK